MQRIHPAPIGVFDSGVGGLTVARALGSRLPHEQLIYLGDTARVPYGTKSPDTVVRYALQIAELLLQRRVKYIVVACNTASAHALTVLQERLPVPVMGVIEPGAALAASGTRRGPVGVIGTLGTVASGAYQRAMQRVRPDLTVVSQACPLLVPLAEEGWIEHPIAIQVIRHYLLELHSKAAQLEALVLGCTHYPLFREPLAREAEAIFGRSILLIDSADAVADAVAADLRERGLLEHRRQAEDSFLFSDVSRFAVLAERFLGRPMAKVEHADL